MDRARRCTFRCEHETQAGPLHGFADSDSSDEVPTHNPNEPIHRLPHRSLHTLGWPPRRYTVRARGESGHRPRVVGHARSSLRRHRRHNATFRLRARSLHCVDKAGNARRAGSRPQSLGASGIRAIPRKVELAGLEPATSWVRCENRCHRLRTFAGSLNREAPRPRRFAVVCASLPRLVDQKLTTASSPAVIPGHRRFGQQSVTTWRRRRRGGAPPSPPRPGLPTAGRLRTPVRSPRNPRRWGARRGTCRSGSACSLRTRSAARCRSPAGRPCR